MGARRTDRYPGGSGAPAHPLVAVSSGSGYFTTFGRIIGKLRGAVAATNDDQGGSKGLLGDLAYVPQRAVTHGVNGSLANWRSASVKLSNCRKACQMETVLYYVARPQHALRWRIVMHTWRGFTAAVRNDSRNSCGKWQYDRTQALLPDELRSKNWQTVGKHLMEQLNGRSQTQD
jgi:hypothetical protein